MFAAALIVFRETLEAALFIGIVAAATRQVVGRARWLLAGIALGALGAGVLALMATTISAGFDGLGHDVLNIAVLALALAMLLWHCTWVATHGQQMALQARQLGRTVQDGQRPPWALLLAVSLAVLREGLETVLFVAGSLQGSVDHTPGSLLLACAGGLALGAAVGLLLYAGLTRVPARHVFAATNLLIALLAASMASQLARAVAQAGWLESGTQPLWDSSRLLEPDSLPGTLLHALVGYDAQPSAAQLAAYVVVLALILVGTRLLSASPALRR